MSHDCIWLSYVDWKKVGCQVKRGMRAEVDEQEKDFKRRMKFCQCMVVEVKSHAKGTSAGEAKYAKKRQVARKPAEREVESPQVQQMSLVEVPVLRPFWRSLS